MDFPITINSQDEFDAHVKERLARETAKYADYATLKAQAAELATIRQADYPKQLADLQAKLTASDKDLKDITDKANASSKSVEELTAKLQASELSNLRVKIANESGIPITFADRLKGTNQAELEADAKAMAQILGKQPVNQPMGGNDLKKKAPPKGGTSSASGNDDFETQEALREMASTLFGKRE